MELSHKTTILFPPRLHEHLRRIAQQRGTSIGELVRRACELQYEIVSKESRLDAAQRLGALALPVNDVVEMKRQSVPPPSDLLP